MKDADPSAERTIGIMTKCDQLAHGDLGIIKNGLFSDVSPLDISFDDGARLTTDASYLRTQ